MHGLCRKATKLKTLVDITQPLSYNHIGSLSWERHKSIEKKEKRAKNNLYRQSYASRTQNTDKETKEKCISLPADKWYKTKNISGWIRKPSFKLKFWQTFQKSSLKESKQWDPVIPRWNYREQKNVSLLVAWERHWTKESVKPSDKWHKNSQLPPSRRRVVLGL